MQQTRARAGLEFFLPVLRGYKNRKLSQVWLNESKFHIEPFFFFDLPVLTGTVDYILKADIYEERQNTEVMQALKKKIKAIHWSCVSISYVERLSCEISGCFLCRLCLKKPKRLSNLMNCL